jgi:hypothetical protein
MSAVFPHLRHDKKNIRIGEPFQAFRCGCFFIYEFGKHAWKIPLTVPNESRARPKNLPRERRVRDGIGTKIDFCTDEQEFVPILQNRIEANRRHLPPETQVRPN